MEPSPTFNYGWDTIILYLVHVSDLQRRDWAEQRNSVLESAVDVYKRNKALPIS